MPDISPDVARELEALDDALAGRRVAPDLTELGDLALLLREDRPAPSDEFVHQLDRRAKHGFPKGDPRARTPRRRWFAWHEWMGPASAIAAIGLIVTVVAVTAQQGSDDAGGGGGAIATGGSSAASEDAGGGGSASSADSAGSGGGDDPARLAQPESVAPAPSTGSPGSDARDRRKVERSASLTLAARPRNIDAVSARIQDVTRQQGGFVVTSTVNSSRSGGHGEFELRIPTRNLDAAMAALSRLAAVRERAQRAEDITALSVSTRSRLKDARTERKSLLTQLADADTPEETESIRERLDIVSREIERARAAVRRVNNRAAFSTVQVTLVADRGAGEPGEVEDDGAWSPGDAWNDAMRVLEVIAGVALIALAVALPLALVLVLVILALRLGRRRSREHALDAI